MFEGARLIRQRAHRIPRFEDDRLLRGEVGEAAEVFPLDGGLEDVLIEPAIRADIVALFAVLVAPTVFNLPAGRLSGFVEVHAGEHHGVIHGGEAVIQRVGLVHGQREAGQRGEIKAAIIPNAQRALAEMADVAAEPDDLARLELGDDRGLEFVHRQVEVDDGAAFDDVAQQADGVGLVIGLIGRRGVDDADDLIEQIADVALGEGQRGEVLFDVIDLIFIDKLKIESLGRLAVAAAEEAVNRIQRLVFFGLNGVRAGFVGSHSAQACRRDLERAVELRVHRAGVAALICFVIDVLGHHAVFADDVGEHIPLAAVVHAGGENVHHRAIGRRQSGGFQNALKEVIAALEFIPKGEIALRQLKIFEVARLSDSLAQNVGRRKEPAAAAGFLVGDLQRRHLDGKLLTHGVRAL